MLRNCPQCGRNLTKADRFFCSACGASLGDAAGIERKKYFVVPPERSEINKAEIFSIKGALLGVGLFLMLAASVLSSSYFTETILSEGGSAVGMVFPKAVTSSEEISVRDASSEAGSGETRTKIESLLPFRTDFAAVFYSSTDFLDALEYLGIENSFSLDFLKNSNRPPYTVLIVPAKEEDDERGIALLFFTEVGNASMHSNYVFGDFTSEASEDILVVTNDEEIKEEIISVSEGLKKGLSLNSSYVNVKNKIPEKVRSEIFVLTNNGVGYVNSLNMEDMPQTFKSLILSYMGSGSYYGFVKYD